MTIYDDLLSGLTGLASNLWPSPAEKPRLVGGKLRPCPGTPNCVCSESDRPGERVEPLVFGTSPEVAWEALKKVVEELGGQLREISGDYIWSTFLIPLFGFTDDVEFRLDAAAKVIHIRSSSRQGYSDLGVNRARVEQLRSTLARRL